MADTYTAPEYWADPEPQFNPVEHAPRPDDGGIAFVVLNSEEVAGVFLGNRPAAHYYAAKLRQHYGVNDDVEIVEVKHSGIDIDAVDPVVLDGGIVMPYRRPWVLVEFCTAVDLETGKVVEDADPKSKVTNGDDAEVMVKSELIGKRGKYWGRVVTSGPDSQVGRLRTLHANEVNALRARVLADIKGEGTK